MIFFDFQLKLFVDPKPVELRESAIQGGEAKFACIKLVDSEHINKNMVQNSSPTCKHNLFTLIQSKKMFVECPAM